MENINAIKEIYKSFTSYEKSELQQKRRIYEKEEGIRFLNLESYVNYLALEVMNKEKSVQKGQSQIA